MTLQTKLQWLCASLFFINIATLRAQNVANDTIGSRIHTIDEVTVSASAPVRNVTSTAPVQMLSRKQLEQQGVTDIADALRRFSRVQG